VEPQGAAIFEVQLLLDVGAQDRLVAAVTRAPVAEARPSLDQLGSR